VNKYKNIANINSQNGNPLNSNINKILKKINNKSDRPTQAALFLSASDSKHLIFWPYLTLPSSFYLPLSPYFAIPTCTSLCLPTSAHLSKPTFLYTYLLLPTSLYLPPSTYLPLPISTYLSCYTYLPLPACLYLPPSTYLSISTMYLSTSLALPHST
jgi:hypothetical protein